MLMPVRTLRSWVRSNNTASMRPRETPSVSWLTLLATTLGAAFTPARWSDWAPALPHGSSGAQIPVVKGEPLANAPRSPTRFGLPVGTASWRMSVPKGTGGAIGRTLAETRPIPPATST